MTIKECYEKIGGDYEGIVGRLRSETIIKKFLGKFLADPSYQALLDALEAGDQQEAFRAAHTLKGICQNLGIMRLHQSSETLTELLRSEKEEDISGALEQLKQDYEETVSAINQLA